MATAIEAKARELRRMRTLATGLLVLMAMVFVAASLGQRYWPWLGAVRAFAEAGMVGACADWFAVTALFRRPMGLPIPHTAVIPRNKDRIGEALGRFIVDNFLTLEVLDAKLRQLELARWGGDWLARPGAAARLARRIAAPLPQILPALPSDALRDAAGSLAVALVRATPTAPAASRVLATVWTEPRTQSALVWGLNRLAAYLEEHDEVIQGQVEAQTARWIPGFVDRFIAEKITAGLRDLLQALEAPDHPWRLKLDEAVTDFARRLASDPELAAEADALKMRLLEDPHLREQAAAMWSHLQQRFQHLDTQALAARLEGLLLAFGEWLRTQPEVQHRLNDWARLVAVRMIAPRAPEIGRFIAQVVAGWDARGVSDRLELQVGRDLQYIRINGTVVGGLVGLAIYAAQRLFGL